MPSKRHSDTMYAAMLDELQKIAATRTDGVTSLMAGEKKDDELLRGLGWVDTGHPSRKLYKLPNVTVRWLDDVPDTAVPARIAVPAYRAGEVGKKDYAKTAATRYEKEIRKGTVTRSQVVPGSVDVNLPGVLGRAQRVHTRNALSAPSTAKALDRLRVIRIRSVGPSARDLLQRHNVSFEAVPLTPYAPLGSERLGGALSSIGIGSPTQVAQSLSVTDGTLAPGNRRVSVQLSPTVGMKDFSPQTPTKDFSILRSTFDHEAAEAKSFNAAAKGAVIDPYASHAGPRPAFAEPQHLIGDPDAFNELKELRTGVNANPEDHRVWNKMKQFGATADRPLPEGGRAYNKLKKWLVNDSHNFSLVSRANAFKLGQNFDVSTIPADVSSSLNELKGGKLVPPKRRLAIVLRNLTWLAKGGR